MRIEWLGQYIGLRCRIFGVLGNDVKVVISLDQSAWGGTRSS
jgi:hypothetical protein